jgi:hypothetical protein
MTILVSKFFDLNIIIIVQSIDGRGGRAIQFLLWQIDAYQLDINDFHPQARSI